MASLADCPTSNLSPPSRLFLFQSLPLRLVSKMRSHGAPQVSHACGLLPARIIGSTSFCGNVAKCAPENDSVAIVHTSRRLRPAGLDILIQPSAWVFVCILPRSESC